MNAKKLLVLILATLSFSALADITVRSKTANQYYQYDLTVTGKDAKVLSSVLGKESFSGPLNSGIELLSCSDEKLCSINIGADHYRADADLRNSELFKANADSILNNKKEGVAITSPTAAYYLWADTRKEHAKTDKKLFGVLKNSKSKNVVEEKSELGTRLTVKSDNLNLSCIKLNRPIVFQYSIIDLGHMDGVGSITKKIPYVCQLNAKIKE